MTLLTICVLEVPGTCVAAGARDCHPRRAACLAAAGSGGPDGILQFVHLNLIYLIYLICICALLRVCTRLTWLGLVLSSAVPSSM